MSTADISSRSARLERDGPASASATRRRRGRSDAKRGRSASARRAAAKCRRPECPARRLRAPPCAKSARGRRSSRDGPNCDCAKGASPARSRRRPAAPWRRPGSRARKSRSSASAPRWGSSRVRRLPWPAVSDRRGWRSAARARDRACLCPARARPRRRRRAQRRATPKRERSFASFAPVLLDRALRRAAAEEIGHRHVARAQRERQSPSRVSTRREATMKRRGNGSSTPPLGARRIGAGDRGAIAREEGGALFGVERSEKGTQVPCSRPRRRWRQGRRGDGRRPCARCRSRRKAAKAPRHNRRTSRSSRAPAAARASLSRKRGSRRSRASGRGSARLRCRASARPGSRAASARRARRAMIAM